MSISTFGEKTMKVAVVGCSHGTLSDIYASIQKCSEKSLEKDQKPVELVLCCGDFQAMRSMPDLQTMACPPKYRALGQFHSYYSGKQVAPFLTIVIGGNHESSSYLWELSNGGWLAPNIFFLGYSGSVLVDGWLRVSGASGIWKSHDYKKGHFETLPYDNSTIRSIYHTREYQIRKLKQLSIPPTGLSSPSPHIVLSHDWPLGIEQSGDVAQLIRAKPFFRAEIESNALGSPPLMELLQTLKPEYWFSAHLHVKFAGLLWHNGRKTVVDHPKQKIENPDEIAIDEESESELKSEEKSQDQTLCGCSHSAENPDEIDMSEDEAPPAVDTPSESSKATRFLALGKPGFGKDFLQILDIPSGPGSSDRTDSPPQLYFDPHWLAITKAFYPYLCTTRTQTPIPPISEMTKLVQDAYSELQTKTKGQLVRVNDIQQFATTAPTSDEVGKNDGLSWYTNPQTEALCNFIGVENRVNPVPEEFKKANAQRIQEKFVTKESELEKEKRKLLAELGL